MPSSTTLTIRIPADEKRALEQMADDDTRSVTSLLRVLIKRERAAREERSGAEVLPLRRPAAKPAKRKAAGR